MTPRFCWPVLAAAALVFGIAMACGDNGGDTGTVRVLLTDAPLDGIAEVNVDIGAVEVHYSEGGNWQTIVEDAGTFDLLKLRNGVEELLGERELPVGKITQIRLYLEAATVKKTGQSEGIPVEIPSEAKTGLKLIGNFDVVAGQVTSILLDFDAEASLSEEDGAYKMNPTIKIVKPGEGNGSTDGGESE